MAALKPIRTTRTTQDLVGQSYCRLTVLRWLGRDASGKLLWECKCECGMKIVLRTQEWRKATKSCGCWRKDYQAQQHTTHGLSRRTEFNIWAKMKDRCYNQKNDSYDRYGGRGITVCPRWLASFEKFFADVGPRPSRKHSLDRFPDNDGNYEPGNVRWATRKEQMRNTSCNRIISWNGETMTIAAWAERLGISPNRIWHRIAKGFSLDEAFSKTKIKKGRMITFAGKTMRMQEWAAEIGVPYKSLRERLRNGWSVARALTTPAMNQFGRK